MDTNYKKYLINICLKSFFWLIKHGIYRGHIEDVIVTHPARRKQVGSKLLECVKQYCKNNGIKVIKLDSDHKLPWAHAFYAKNGGKQTELMFRFDI